MSDQAEQSGGRGYGRVRHRRRRLSEAGKRRHDVNANQVFGWRRQYRELERAVGGFVPVVVSSTEGAEQATLLPAPTDVDPSHPSTTVADLVEA